MTNHTYMRHGIYIIAGLLALTGLASCQEDRLDMDNGGRFDITLVDKPTLTRVLPFDLSDELKAQFSLSIKDMDGKRYFSGSMTDYNAGAPALRPDSYMLQAQYGDNPTLALDNPFYISDETTAVIEAEQVTPVELVCKVGNALASFAFSESTDVTAVMSDYSIVTQVGAETVSSTVDDGHNPYFKAGSNVEFYLRGTTTEGKAVNEKFASIPSAEARTNYKYTLTLGNVPEGSAQLDITVENTVETVTVNETVPQEWLAKPKVSESGFDAARNLDYVETANAVTAAINYQALMPVEDVELTLNMGDPNLQTLNKTYRLASLSAEDRTALENAGITLPALHSETGAVDLTAMTGKLLCLDGGATAENRIGLRVYANKRWSETTECTIHTLRPEFNIGVNENDFWSKEFSVREFTVTAGNATTVTNGTKYQYSTDNGVTWTDFTNGKKQKFATHPDIKNYKVRALYRGTIASNTADVLMETPTQLPNSSLDEWTEENYGSSRYCFYPWTTKNESCHWDTNNTWTTRHRWNNIGTANYNGFHAVSSVLGRNGLAAELRNTANGRGNMLPSTIRNQNKVAGKLLMGTFVATKKGGDSNGNDSWEIKKDATFTVRPTAITFYHKYAPNSGDSWSAHIELIDASGNTFISQDYTSSASQSSWTPQTVTLNYDENTKYPKAAYIYVLFASTTKEGDGMPYSNTTYTYYINNGTEAKTYSRAYVGSILTIDDISLIYDK